MFGRRKRLERWWRETQGRIELASGLIRELVLIIADYIVSLEHLWGPFPDRLRRKPCQLCPKTPSPTFTACKCWKCDHQHVCSIHTIGETTSTEFSIAIKDTAMWWVGIIWSSTVDGLQLHDGFHHDSLTIINGSGYLLNAHGNLFEFDSTAVNAVEESIVAFDESKRRAPTIIRIRILNARTLEFTRQNCNPMIVHTRLLSGARPFVQFHRSLEHAPATIETPLNSSFE
jgi:hypothetical protein